MLHLGSQKIVTFREKKLLNKGGWTPKFFCLFFGNIQKCYETYDIREGLNGKKNVFFRALPESPKPPRPLTPIRATWSFFSEVKIQDLKVSLELNIAKGTTDPRVEFCLPK